MNNDLVEELADVYAVIEDPILKNDGDLQVIDSIQELIGITDIKVNCYSVQPQRKQTNN